MKILNPEGIIKGIIMLAVYRQQTDKFFMVIVDSPLFEEDKMCLYGCTVLYYGLSGFYWIKPSGPRHILTYDPEKYDYYLLDDPKDVIEI